MEIRFSIQDPTNSETTYLYEAIVAAVHGANHWRGLYAFASRGVINHLVAEKATESLLKQKGTIEWVVGIDAITNKNTLERLQALEIEHKPYFLPRIFWNETKYLFHPKVSVFTYKSGRKVLILGSGNLTPAGMYQNFEAYTVIEAEPEEHLDTATIDDFFERQAPNIRVIDDESLAIAAENIVIALQKSNKLGKLKIVPKLIFPKSKFGQAPAKKPVPAEAAVLDRVLIAQIPGAGGRWAQVHMNKEVISTYFLVTDFESQRVYLSLVNQAGERQDEEIRPVIYSAGSNKNMKIEMSGAKGMDYPQNGKPVAVLRERQIRTFDYIIMMPGNSGYKEIAKLAMTLPQVGMGDRRVIATLTQLKASWPECPLLKVSDPAGGEI
jgi:hypothetical protein